MAAKAGGASEVIVVGTDQDEGLRLPTARKIKSIDRVINVNREDATSIVMDLTNGRGADLVVEASGSGPGIASAFQMVRKLGRITAIGLTGKEKIEFPYDAGMFKAVEFTFNLSTMYSSWDKSIRLLDSGEIDAKILTTHKGGLESWETFFSDLQNKKGIKGVLIP
jgi:threonine dehydrogenase-like Zn-dependent dehydrogenase